MKKRYLVLILSFFLTSAFTSEEVEHQIERQQKQKDWLILQVKLYSEKYHQNPSEQNKAQLDSAIRRLNKKESSISEYIEILKLINRIDKKSGTKDSIFDHAFGQAFLKWSCKYPLISYAAEAKMHSLVADFQNRSYCVYFFNCHYLTLLIDKQKSPVKDVHLFNQAYAKAKLNCPELSLQEAESLWEDLCNILKDFPTIEFLQVFFEEVEQRKRVHMSGVLSPHSLKTSLSSP